MSDNFINLAHESDTQPTVGEPAVQGTNVSQGSPDTGISLDALSNAYDTNQIENAPEVNAEYLTPGAVWDTLKYATGNMTPQERKSFEFAADMVLSTLKTDFLGGDDDARANIIVNNSGNRYEKIVRRVPQEEKDSKWTFSGLVADNEILIRDTETGDVFSMNEPGFGLRDLSQFVRANAIEGGIELLKSRIPGLRSIPNVNAALTSLLFGANNFAQQQVRQGMGSGEETNIGEVALSSLAGGVGSRIDTHGAYALGNMFGIGDKIYDATNSVKTLVDDSLGKTSELMGKLFNVEMPKVLRPKDFSTVNTVNSLYDLDRARKQGYNPALGGLSVSDTRRAEQNAQENLLAMQVGENIDVGPDAGAYGVPLTPYEQANRANPESVETRQLRKEEARLRQDDPETFTEIDNTRAQYVKDQIKNGYFGDIQANRYKQFETKLNEINDKLGTYERDGKMPGVYGILSEADVRSLEKQKAFIESEMNQLVNLADQDPYLLRQDVVENVKQTSDTMIDDYRPNYKMYDKATKDIPLTEEIVAGVLPKLSPSEFGSKEALEVEAELIDLISPRKAEFDKKTGEVLESYPTDIGWLQAGERYLNRAITDLYNAGKNKQAGEVELFLDQYRTNVQTVLANMEKDAAGNIETARKAIVDASDEVKNIEETRLPEIERLVNEETAIRDEGIRKKYSPEGYAMQEEERAMADVVMGGAAKAEPGLGVPPVDQPPTDTAMESLSRLGETPKIADDRPDTVTTTTGPTAPKVSPSLETYNKYMNAMKEDLLETGRDVAGINRGHVPETYRTIEAILDNIRKGDIEIVRDNDKTTFKLPKVDKDVAEVLNKTMERVLKDNPELEGTIRIGDIPGGFEKYATPAIDDYMAVAEKYLRKEYKEEYIPGYIQQLKRFRSRIGEAAGEVPDDLAYSKNDARVIYDAANIRSVKFNKDAWAKTDKSENAEKMVNDVQKFLVDAELNLTDNGGTKVITLSTDRKFDVDDELWQAMDNTLDKVMKDNPDLTGTFRIGDLPGSYDKYIVPALDDLIATHLKDNPKDRTTRNVLKAMRNKIEELRTQRLENPVKVPESSTLKIDAEEYAELEESFKNQNLSIDSEKDRDVMLQRLTKNMKDAANDATKKEQLNRKITFLEAMNEGKLEVPAPTVTREADNVNISGVLGKKPESVPIRKPGEVVDELQGQVAKDQMDAVLGGGESKLGQIRKGIDDAQENIIKLETEKIELPLAAKKELEKAGVDLEEAYKFFDNITAAVGGKFAGDKFFTKYKKVFPTDGALAKVAQEMTANARAVEKATGLLFTARGNPSFGTEVAKAIKTNPLLQARVEDYLVFRTFMDEDGNFLTGDAIKKNWKYFKRDPIPEVLGKKKFAELEKEVNKLSELELAATKHAVRGRMDDSFKRLAERIANRSPHPVTRIMALVTSEARDKVTDFRNKEDIKNYVIATMNGWSNVPTLGKKPGAKRIGIVGTAAGLGKINDQDEDE